MSDQPNPVPGKLDIGGVLQILPHRYPMLLIDRIVEFEPGTRLVAIKNVTINEPFFQGHFPGYPIMPGVLIVEAMAQAGGATVHGTARARQKAAGLHRHRSRKFSPPGHARRSAPHRGRSSRLPWDRRTPQGKAYVDGKLACEAVVTCRLLNRPPAGGTTTAPEPETAGEAS